MGRLFWKVLLFTLLAQFITALGIGLAIHFGNVSSAHSMGRINQSPAAAIAVSAAAATMHYGGIRALQDLLTSNPRGIYAINDKNNDLLNREISLNMIKQARALYAGGSSQQVSQMVEAESGERYLFFISSDIDTGPGFDRPPLPDTKSPHGDGAHPPGEHPPSPAIPITSALLASLLFSTMIAWYFSKPIKNLRSAFESVANGNLDVNAVAGMGGRRDELTDLGRDFDRMVLRLRALLDSQRHLMHDISHELRSPLARLHVAAGLARQQPERLDESLQRIEHESERMDKLVGELLTLHKLDAGAVSSNVEIVYMAELIANIVSDTQFEAQALGKQLYYSGDSAVCIRGDSELIRQAIENVLRNALKHSAIGSGVLLEAKIMEGFLQLTILDCGPGVPENELSRIFEPFFRGVGNPYNSDGHGLGLAIARRILNNMGGRIAAANREEGGLKVEISLPLHSIPSIATKNRT